MYLPRGSPDLVDVLCLRGRPITGLGLAPGGGVRAKWWWCATKERWCAASGYLKEIEEKVVVKTRGVEEDAIALDQNGRLGEESPQLPPFQIGPPHVG